jgi:hypothetical protein
VHLGNAEDELNALVGRQYPLFKQSQKAIAEAEANLSVLRDATARPGAGENGFTATQLNSAVLAQKARVPKYAYRGPDPAVYGLANNASAIMGSSIPKAGPAPTPASIGMLGLPSIPYLMTGRGLPNAFEAMNPRAQSLAPIASVQIPMAPISPILPTSLSALSQTAAAQQPPSP